jgi:hypothetical protein
MLTVFGSDVLTMRNSARLSLPSRRRVGSQRRSGCDNLMQWFLRSLDDAYCLLRRPSPKATHAAAAERCRGKDPIAQTPVAGSTLVCREQLEQ